MDVPYVGDQMRGAEWSSAARVRLVEFAEKYPMVPLRAVVDCLLEADRAAAVIANVTDCNVVAVRLAAERLDHLNDALV